MHNAMFTRANPKTRKGESLGYDTLVLHLAPANQAGCGSVCPFATRGCMASCLNTAGRGVMSTVQNARIRRTRTLFPHGVDAGPSPEALHQLNREISLALGRANRAGRKLAVRLNGTSDLPWETYSLSGAVGGTLMQRWPSVQFYDYTKSVSRMVRYLAGAMPPNYHLTFSRSETNTADAWDVLQCGGNVAIVTTREPETLGEAPRINGDAHDLTFLHAPGAILYLTPKGRARRDTTGFVLR